MISENTTEKMDSRDQEKDETERSNHSAKKKK